MEKGIQQFLAKHKLATIGCIDTSGNPYCFNCFVAFDEKENKLFYKTAPDSHHAQLMQPGQRVGGTLLPDKLAPLFTSGVQFTATVLNKADEDAMHHAARVYYKKFPFALAVPGELWGLQLEWVKLTDQQKGSKRKLQWQREEG